MFGWIGQQIDKAFSGGGIFASAARAVSNTVLAPVHLVGDIASGKNLFESIGTRAIQGTGGAFGVGGSALFQVKPVRQVTSSLSPYTLGLTQRAQEAADITYKAENFSSDQLLTKGEVYTEARNTAEIGAVVYGAANAGAILGAAKTYGPAASTLALAGKLVTGKGTGADLAALSGVDQSYIDPLSSLYQGYKDAAPTAAPGPIGPDTSSGLDPGVVPELAAATNKSSLSPYLVLGGVVLLGLVVARSRS